ncbi:MAG: hypothetical protein WEE20_00115 [Bacteroidota bacterium]
MKIHTVCRRVVVVQRPENGNGGSALSPNSKDKKPFKKIFCHKKAQKSQKKDNGTVASIGYFWKLSQQFLCASCAFLWPPFFSKIEALSIPCTEGTGTGSQKHLLPQKSSKVTKER